MTVGSRLASLAFLFSAAISVTAQQSWGPSMQQMYRQHPGSAPSFVNYGEPTYAPPVAALHTPVSNAPATARAAAKRTTRTAHRPVARHTSYGTR